MGGQDNFGEANRQTFAAQVIDPVPIYGTAVPETHAEHAAQAIERYRTDKVKLPDRVKTGDGASKEPGR
jgi:type IV pilus biogenesis protein CpaD/CtpE